MCTGPYEEKALIKLNLPFLFVGHGLLKIYSKHLQAILSNFQLCFFLSCYIQGNLTNKLL